MFFEDLINRIVINTKIDKKYRIVHLPKKYGDNSENAGHFYISTIRMEDGKPNKIHVNMRTYNNYAVIGNFGKVDEKATKLLHDITMNLN